MALTQSKSWNRLAQFALRTIIFFSIAFATLWTVLSFWPGLAILPFVGRAKISPFCSTWQAVRDAAVKVRQGELEKEIRANTRLIRTEKGYKLWSTPGDGSHAIEVLESVGAVRAAHDHILLNRLCNTMDRPVFLAGPGDSAVRGTCQDQPILLDVAGRSGCRCKGEAGRTGEGNTA